MTDPNATITVHHGTIKEHLAGIHAAQVWHQDLAAQHLLRTQSPIRDQPVPPAEPTP